MKHKSNKIVNFMFMLAMSVLLLQMFTPTAQAVTQVSTLDVLKSALSNGGDIQLTADIINNGNDPLTISKNTSLDLNGFGILMTGNKEVIKIDKNITLTLSDSDPNTTHYITLNEQGRGISVSTTQTGNAIEVKGGYITGGIEPASHHGGGIIVYTQSTLKMRGGSIIGNTANYGGGVYVAWRFEMSGGSITGNTVISDDGHGGGVCFNNIGSLKISGSPNITGNFNVGGVQQRITFI